MTWKYWNQSLTGFSSVRRIVYSGRKSSFSRFKWRSRLRRQCLPFFSDLISRCSCSIGRRIDEYGSSITLRVKSLLTSGGGIFSKKWSRGRSCYTHTAICACICLQISQKEGGKGSVLPCQGSCKMWLTDKSLWISKRSNDRISSFFKRETGKLPKNTNRRSTQNYIPCKTFGRFQRQSLLLYHVHSRLIAWSHEGPSPLFGLGSVVEFCIKPMRNLIGNGWMGWKRWFSTEL